MNITVTAEIIDVASFVVGILMLFVAIGSAFYAFKAYKHQKERAKKATACELAKYYAENIIEDGTVIVNALAMSGYRDYITDIVSYDDMQEFTKKEFEQILKKKSANYSECLDRIKKIDPGIVFRCRLARVYSLEKISSAINDTVKFDEDHNAQYPTASNIRTDFMQDVTKLMNMLEWFSMNCFYGIADEKILYQSLHKTFLSTMLLLYPLICDDNDCNADKCFTNAIWLFTKWRDRLNQITDVPEAKRKKLLRKLERIEQKVYSGKRI